MANYKADGHEAQMKILRQLLLSRESSFTDLMKSTELESDHANFHIKQLIAAGFVEHAPKSYGVYALTRAGKEYANRMDTDERVIEKQPKLSVVLVIENESGEFLLQQRLKHPYFDYWGHPTGKIRWGETMIEAGARELLEETGLTATLRPVGFFHKLDYDDAGALLEDKYFCLIHGTDPLGDLIIDMEGHHNEWMTHDEYELKPNRFGNVTETTEYIRSPHPFLKETKYRYEAASY